MAGRPKKMAERATELDTMASALAVEVFAAAPEQYRGADSDPRDAIGALWKRCVSDAIRLSLQMEVLADLLRKKAGLATVPEPDEEEEETEGEPCGEGAAELLAEDRTEVPASNKPKRPEEHAMGEGLYEQVFRQSRTLKIARQVAKAEGAVGRRPGTKDPDPVD
ncbi:MAG: hypothetical protein SYC29_04945 [Planctomycetota bacterium]|nr:hypothetical protein [Planctomycetota bacterium]